MALEIRRVRPEEYDRAGELTAQVYADGGFVPREDPYSRKLADVADRAQRGETWVAVEGAELLGVVTYCPTGSPYRELAKRTDEGEFRMLAVAPTARGRGVGTALVEAMLTRAREDGHDRLVMCTMSTMTEAARVYQRLGFARMPERDWIPDDTELELSLLAYCRNV